VLERRDLLRSTGETVPPAALFCLSSRPPTSGRWDAPFTPQPGEEAASLQEHKLYCVSDGGAYFQAMDEPSRICRSVAGFEHNFERPVLTPSSYVSLPFNHIFYTNMPSGVSIQWNS